MTRVTGMDWTLERVPGPGYRGAILDLRKTVFAGENPEKQDPNYWDWEFERSFFGKAEVFAALDKDPPGLIGHYALLPQRYRIHGKSVSAGLAVDAMVHPLRRRKGLFSSLQAFSLSHTEQAFAIGYTIRKEVLPAELKGGYRIVHKAPVFVYPIRFEVLAGRLLRSGFAAGTAGKAARALHRLLFPPRRVNEGYAFTSVESLSPSLKGFFERQTLDEDIFLEKSAEYIAWRVDRIPSVAYDKVVASDREGRTAGYAVLRRENLFGLDTLAVVDLETTDPRPETGDALIRFILSRAGELGCDCAAMLLLDGGSLSGRLKRAGFLKSPYAFNLIVHNCGRGNTADTFRRSKRVRLNWCDTDML
jgi:hypothetical protein